MINKPFPALVFFFLVLTLCARAAHSAMSGSGGGGAETRKVEGIDWVAVPIPNYNTALGFGLGVMGAAFYNLDPKDTISPPSVSTVFGFVAQNETYIAGLAQKLYLDQDRYRATFAAALASIHFQVYNPLSEVINLDNAFIDYNIQSPFVYLDGTYQFLPNTYAGLVTRTSWSTTTFDLPFEVKPLSGRYSGLGWQLEYDTRDNVNNPSQGVFASWESLYFREAWASDLNYEIYKVEGKTFSRLHAGGVLGLRLFARAGTNDVPFEDLSILRSRVLRGYSQGKYRDRQVYSVQGEYRWNFHGPWGLVGFLGASWVIPEISRFRFDEALPGAGVGLRFRAIEQRDINIGLDLGVGREDYSLQFRIAEAF